MNKSLKNDKSIQMITTQVFVTIATLNLEKLTQFYTQLFSTNPTQIITGKYSEFQLHSCKLAIFTPKLNQEDEFSNSQQSSLSLCVTVEDLDSAIAHLHQLGYTQNHSVNTASHGRELYIYDPDGNRIIFYQPFHRK